MSDRYSVFLRHLDFRAGRGALYFGGTAAALAVAIVCLGVAIGGRSARLHDLLFVLGSFAGVAALCGLVIGFIVAPIIVGLVDLAGFRRRVGIIAISVLSALLSGLCALLVVAWASSSRQDASLLFSLDATWSRPWQGAILMACVTGLLAGTLYGRMIWRTGR